MTVMLIISILIVLIAIPTYPYWSYKQWYERCENEAKQRAGKGDSNAKIN